MLELAVVIPVYNEYNRFNMENLDHFFDVDNVSVKLFLIDDGSTDNLFFDIESYTAIKKLNVEIVKLDFNEGKAEALRQGFLRSIEENFSILLMADADFSASVSEVLNLGSLLNSTGKEIVLGSRLKTSDNEIVSKISRFLAGRVFAIQVRFLFGLKIYDTQCGYKAFRNTHEFRNAISKPFLDRWLFDLELLLRIRSQNPAKVLTWLEYPLQNWVEVPHSKVLLRQKFRAIRSLYKLKFSILKGVEPIAGKR